MKGKPVEERLEIVTNQPYLTDFPLTIFANAKRRLQAELRAKRTALANHGINSFAVLFEQVLPPDFLAELDTTSRERHFPMFVVFWAWLAQCLNFNASCSKAVSLIQSWSASQGLPIPSSGTGGYCQARQRLPLSFLEAVARKSTSHLDCRASERDQWRGFTLKAIDGSSLQLADTEENQAKYPQPTIQKKGCGFPTMGIVGITNLTHGGWEGFETCGWQKHDARMAPRLLKHIESADLLLADRAFCSYEFIARITTERQGHVLMRLHQARHKKLDWRRGKRVNSYERLVEWKKPTRPATSELTQEEWEALPETLTLRYIKMGYEDRDGKTRPLVVVTDLIDPIKFPGDELIDLYARRWEIEVKLRDIKTTLGFELVRVQTPEMAHKSLLMILIAYNLIRSLMQTAASLKEKPVWHLSFKGVVDQVNSSGAGFLEIARHPMKKLRMRVQFLRICATKLLKIRPHRREPRAVKRRPKGYQLLTKPRHLFREIQHRSAYRKSS